MALRALGAGRLLASDSLPCWRKSRRKTMVRHRFRGLLPFCLCLLASRQKGRRVEIGSPSWFCAVAHHAAQPPHASRPPLYSLLCSLVNRSERYFVAAAIYDRASIPTYINKGGPSLRDGQAISASLVTAFTLHCSVAERRSPLTHSPPLYKFYMFYTANPLRPRASRP